MEISQLLSFNEIVKTGSYSKAAESLSITQSAISHQIKNLERELNIKLFDRVGNAVRLTEEGQILFDYVIKFLNDLEDLKKIPQEIIDCRIGYLTIATNNAILRNVLPDFIKNFKAKFPGIRFKLISRSITSMYLPIVLEGEVDMLIGPKFRQWAQPQINFVFWKSFDNLLCIPKGHPLSRKKTIKLADIAKYPLLLYRRGSAIRDAVERAFNQKGISYEILMEIDDAENVKNFVKMGLGISIFSSLNVNDRDKEKFSFINVNNFFGNLPYGIYYRRGRYITAAMKQFIRFFAPELCDKFPLK
jgi:DNA-binding transcriptional LysR family regulator